MDQLNCAAFLSFEVLARLAQVMLAPRMLRTPKWTTARHFRCADGMDVGIDPSHWVEVNRKVGEENLIC